MSELLNFVIFMVRCNHTKEPCGYPLEEKARGQWIADWAFAVKETRAKRRKVTKVPLISTLPIQVTLTAVVPALQTRLWQS